MYCHNCHTRRTGRKARRGYPLTGVVHVSGPPWPPGWRALHAGRVAPFSRRHGGRRPGPATGDQVPVADRVMPGGQLEHAVEEQPRGWRAGGVRVRSKIVPAVTDVRAPRTRTGHHQVASRQHGRNPGRQSPPANAATPGSPGSRRRCGTGLELASGPGVVHASTRVIHSFRLLRFKWIPPRLVMTRSRSI